LALITDWRIVMKNGAVAGVLEPGNRERAIIGTVSGMDAFLWDLREKIRGGELIGDSGTAPASSKKAGVSA
ncbi:MAG: ABC transporter ATP-binding protein, partial [Methanoregula sp.]